MRIILRAADCTRMPYAYQRCYLDRDVMMARSREEADETVSLLALLAVRLTCCTPLWNRIR
jgi:hypothetical protein